MLQFKHPLNLPGRDTFLRTAHQVDDLQPQMQGQVAILKNGAHADRKGFVARNASHHPVVLPLKRPMRLIPFRNAGIQGLRPKPGLDRVKSGGFVLELGAFKPGLAMAKSPMAETLDHGARVCQV